MASPWESQKYDHGGNLWFSTAYLARWGGPVLESDDAYGDGSTPAGLGARKHVQDISWYAPRSSATDNDRIKYALTTRGAVYVSMSWQNGASYYNSTTRAYYYNGSASTNHAVLIVGWDDDYPAANFATAPGGNGAFIVKNSWGSGWGASGYFYVSYYDTSFGRGSYAATFEGVESTTNYDTVYQHDPLGDVSDFGNGTTTCWGANKFTAATDSRLRAVAFYAEVPSTAYEVYEGASTGSLTKIAEGTLQDMGFHTVALPSGPALTAGSPFVVAVKVTTPGYQYPLAIEYPVAGYSSAAQASPGQSYYSATGATWSDLTDWNAEANVCLKAYTSSAAGPTSASSYGFAADAASGWKTSSQSVTVTAGGGDGTGRSVRYSTDGGSTWTTVAGDSATATVSSEGAHHVKYYAFDSLATETTHDAGWVNIDSVAPSTSDDHLTASLVAPATVRLTPTDATSGMSGGAAKTEYKIDDAQLYSTGTAVVLSAGTHTVRYRSTDKAGNVETTDKTFTVTVTGSGSPTSTSAYRFAPDAVSGWKNASQTVAVTAAAGLGGGLEIFFSGDGGTTWSSTSGGRVDIFVATQGSHHCLFYAKDTAAAESVHDAGYVNIDSGKPSTSATAASVRKGRRVTLKFRVSDATPGCGRAVVKLQIRKRTRVVKTIVVGKRATNAALTYRYIAKLKKGTYTYRVLATDIAGNVAGKMVSKRLVIR